MTDFAFDCQENIMRKGKNAGFKSVHSEGC